MHNSPLGEIILAHSKHMYLKLTNIYNTKNTYFNWIFLHPGKHLLQFCSLQDEKDIPTR